MKKLIPLLLILSTYISFSQTKRVYEHYSFGFGNANKVAASSFSYTQTITLGKDNAYRLGTGFRLNGFYTKNRDFEPVDNKLKGTTITAKQRMGTNSINIPIIAEFHSKKLLVGLNFDLIGFSFGRSKDSLTLGLNKYLGKLDSLSSNVNGISLQLFGKQSRGTLNSEIYVGYNLADEITIRAGVAIMRSDFRARYVPKSGKETTLGKYTMNQVMPFIGIVLNIER